MIVLTPDTKACMSALLLNTVFDDFQFVEGSITTFNTFTIDGYIHPDFYEDSKEAPGTFSSWSLVKDYCLRIIRGRRTPLKFHLIFALSKEMTNDLLSREGLHISPETIQGLYLNFRFEEGILTCTTGTSLSIFTMDKSLEHAFDDWMRAFFAASQISCT